MAKDVAWKFDLTLFDGGAGAGAGGGEGGTGSDTGATAEAAAPTPTRRHKENPLAHVRYGKQEEAPQAAPQAQEEQADPEGEWKAAKEKYKDYFNRDTSSIVQDRLKNSKQAEATLAKLTPLLEQTAKKYGKEATDIDGMMAAYTDDDSLYEEEAAKAGMSVSAFKQLAQLQAEKQQREAFEAKNMQEQRFQQHFRNVAMDFEQNVKSVFPNADLMAELRNPTFQRLTSPEVGVSAKDAFWLIHRAELESKTMETVAHKTQQKLSQSMQNTRNRPVENGSRAVSPALDIRDDPSKWSKADREEVKRRVRNGEKVIL